MLAGEDRTAARDERGTAVSPTSAVDLGPLVSWLALKEGVSIYDAGSKRIGVVDEVVADPSMDIFDGIVIHTLPLPGKHLFAGVDQVAEMHERGVLLAVDGGALVRYHEAAFRRNRRRSEPADGRAAALLRRVWDVITGRRPPHR
jgi:hypothetical protein